MTITPLYAGLLALLYLFLSTRVIARRRAAQVALGDGNDETLRRRLRVHGNFAEYVPLTLILMMLIELQHGPAWLAHGVGLALLLGRCAHAYGVAQDPEPFRYRTTGMALTFTAMTAGAVGTLVLAAGH